MSREFWHLILSPMVDFVKEQSHLAELCSALGKTEHLTNDVDNENWLDKSVRGMPEVHLPSLALIVARHTLYPGEVADWMKLACKTFAVDVKGVRKGVVAAVDAEDQAEADRLEIENGVSWSLPLSEKVEEFTWLDDCDCANSNVAEVKLPKGGGTWRALVATGRTHKGWHMGYEVQHGKKVLVQKLPNMNEVSYANAALATRAGLLAISAALKDTNALPSTVERVGAYIEAVKLPAEKIKPKAPKAAKGKKSRGDAEAQKGKNGKKGKNGADSLGEMIKGALKGAWPGVLGVHRISQLTKTEHGVVAAWFVTDGSKDVEISKVGAATFSYKPPGTEMPRARKKKKGGAK